MAHKFADGCQYHTAHSDVDPIDSHICAARLERLSWLRLPAGHALRAQVESEGTRVWYKLAPLLPDEVCAFEDEPLSRVTSERCAPSRSSVA